MRYATLLLLLLLPLTAAAQQAPLFEITGTTTLRWQAPTQNVDGTPLEDLCCYKIYWGEQSRNYTQELDVPDGTSTNRSFSFPLNSEGQTNWYFAMTALDDDGNESAYSNEILKIVTVTVTDNRPPAPPVLDEVDMQLTCIGTSTEIICTITVVDG